MAAPHRPIRIPALDAAGGCPSTPVGRTAAWGSISYAGGPDLTAVNALQGTGPAYASGLDESSIANLPFDDGWYGNKFLVAIDDREVGSVLLRGVRIDRTGRVAFDNNGTLEAIVGVEPIGSGPPRTPAPSDGRVRITRFYVAGIAVAGAGCYALQADTATSSTTIVFRVEERPVPGDALLSADPSRALLARPFGVQRVADACPVGPVSVRAGVGHGVGDGQLFLAKDDGTLHFRDASGAVDRRQDRGEFAVKTTWVNTDPIARPIVMRAARLDGPGLVRFEGGLVQGTQGYLYLGGD
ncbi:MAG: hypothetical protein QOF49_1498, partial [Chloroflexota bacterium]|nr:hypothetical protein [Chloroflexota bacterium]